jgi:hypothetical protein
MPARRWYNIVQSSYCKYFLLAENVVSFEVKSKELPNQQPFAKEITSSRNLN